MYTLANDFYVVSSDNRFVLFLDRLDDKYQELKRERFECIRKFMAEKISHMTEPHYRLTLSEEEEIKTMLNSLFAIKEHLQDGDK